MEKKSLIYFLGILLLFSSTGCDEQVAVKFENNLRAPGYPLITIDPYTSAWSFTDNLYDSSVKHWTEKSFPFIGVLKVDGNPYRFMGMEEVDLYPIANTSEQGDYWTGKYTMDKPAGNWMSVDFNDAGWQSGPAAFGTMENEVTAKTQWDSEFIWVRRDILLDENLKGKEVYLEYSHDDDVILYVNGVEVVNTGNACWKNVLLKLPEEVVNTLNEGKNVIAGYCYNRVANALLDFGLFVEKEDSKYFGNTAVQKSADVQPMQTHYKFTCGDVDLKLTFTAPLFLDKPDLISRPVNYISYEINSNDKKAHEVEIYFEASPRWALDQPMQESSSEGFEQDNLIFLKTGTLSQNILGKSGDDRRIDWGYFYMVAEKENTTYGIGEAPVLRSNFINNVNSNAEGSVANGQMTLTRTFGSVKEAKGKIMIGYDDIYSIQYFGDNLRPFWNRNGSETIVNQFQKACAEYDRLMKDCYTFDNRLMEKAIETGGRKYAELCALAYRQAIAAHKLVESPNGELLFLSKENNSNGSIGTVDVTYPSAPLFLLYNPELAKGLLNHIFEYSESGRWTKPFAAHDIGTYPLANGQTYGGDMPLEESGNMLILTAAIAAIEGNAKYAEKHWDILTVWTDYLVEFGLDPENQLCTDDFAGHFAHNTNLSIKAIMAIASYGYLADKLGKTAIAGEYTDKAKEMAAKWEKMADDGDHYRLTFDKPGSWSLKYNIVWDNLLDLNIFDEKIVPKEIAFYLNKQNKYGLPLDNRSTYTKADWIIWTATLTDDQQTFEKFIDPVHLFVNETVDRVPMSDWIYTDKPTRSGFKARSVVGGYYIKMLKDKLKK